MPICNGLYEVYREGLDDETLTQRHQQVLDFIESDELDVSKLSLREVLEATCPQVKTSALMNPMARPYEIFQEAAGSVRSSAFTNITGKMLLDGVLAGFQAEATIGDQLFDEFTSNDDGGRWGGIEDLDADGMEVKEGEEFPDAKLSEDYVDTPYSVKRGRKIGITKEALHFDKTEQIRRNAMMVGNRIAIAKEIRRLEVFIGYVNPYKRRGTVEATYKTTGNRPNLLTGNELVDWTDIEAALTKFANMGDDRVNAEPIEVNPTTLVIMPGKIFTARRILNASEVRHTTSTNIETTSSNPITENYPIVSSNRLYQLIQRGKTDPFTGTTFPPVSAADAAKWWFFGDFKRTFKYRTIFPLATITAGPEHPDNFDRDIVLQARASERGVPFVVDPWYTMKLTG